MKEKHRLTKKRNGIKSVLRLPVWNMRKPQCSTVSLPWMLSEGIVMLLTNLLSGIVPNRAWHSTESSSYATALILNHANSHPAQSICVSVLYAVLHTKLRIAVFSAL